MNKARISTYDLLNKKLALLSDQGLQALIETANPLGKSIGGTSLLLEFNGIPIFIKKIKLTDVEKQPENRMSTRNIFNLPLFYQYGVGSTGFGVWRELAVHIMANNWVVTGECAHFPLMYHYRILSLPKPTITKDELAKIEQDVKY